MSPVTKLQTLRFPPSDSSKSQKFNQAILFLHGLGASAHDFSDLPSVFNIPDTLYIFPQAPERSVTVNSGMMMPAWYDIKNIELEREVDSVTVENSTNLLVKLIEKIEEEVPSNRIFLGGFSQGGAMSLEVGLRYPKTLGGIISLSAYFLSQDHLVKKNHPQQTTPIFVAHGEQDAVVPFVLGKTAENLLKQHNFNVEWYSNPFLAHNVDAPELETLKTWLLVQLEK